MKADDLPSLISFEKVRQIVKRYTNSKFFSYETVAVILYMGVLYIKKLGPLTYVRFQKPTSEAVEALLVPNIKLNTVESSLS